MSGRSFYTLAEAAAAIGCTFSTHQRGNEVITQTFRVDSREIARGDGFIAMRGERTDGHLFVENAINAGASIVILEHDHFAKHKDDLEKLGAMYLIAKDGTTSESAAVALASAWLRDVAPKTVGITGSVGKTTTRDILACVLRQRYGVHAAPKSYNTLIGCAMTILSMRHDTDVLVLEFGTNHPGEISAMVKNFPVENAIITEVCEAHLEGLGSLDGVLKAKMEITASRDLKCMSYNFNNVILRDAVASLKGRIDLCGVGGEGADIRISDIKQSVSEDGDATLTFVISHQGRASVDISASIYGGHNAMNAALAYSAASKYGVTNEEFANAFDKIRSPKGRNGLHTTSRGAIVIDDTYNANPASMAQALKNAADIDMKDGSRLVAILGGMRELGTASADLHRRIFEKTSAFDEIHLVGAEWSAVADIDKRATIWKDAASFISAARPDLPRGSVVLVKGSRYYALEDVVKAIDDGGVCK